MSQCASFGISHIYVIFDTILQVSHFALPVIYDFHVLMMVFANLQGLIICTLLDTVEPLLNDHSKYKRNSVLEEGWSLIRGTVRDIQKFPSQNTVSMALQAQVNTPDNSD